jgi:hypothetical protein
MMQSSYSDFWGYIGMKEHSILADQPIFEKRGVVTGDWGLEIVSTF